MPKQIRAVGHRIIHRGTFVRCDCDPPCERTTMTDSPTDPYADDERYQDWPVRAILILCPTAEVAGVEFASKWVRDQVMDQLNAADPNDERKMIDAGWMPVKDREYFVNRAGVVYDALVMHAKQRGIELPGHEIVREDDVIATDKGNMTASELASTDHVRHSLGLEVEAT